MDDDLSTDVIGGEGLDAEQLDRSTLDRLCATYNNPGAPQRLQARIALRVAEELSNRDLSLCQAFGLNPLVLLAERASQAEAAARERWRREEHERNEAAARQALARHMEAERERLRRVIGTEGWER